MGQTREQHGRIRISCGSNACSTLDHCSSIAALVLRVWEVRACAGACVIRYEATDVCLPFTSQQRTCLTHIFAEVPVSYEQEPLDFLSLISLYLPYSTFTVISIHHDINSRRYIITAAIQNACLTSALATYSTVGHWSVKQVPYLSRTVLTSDTSHHSNSVRFFDRVPRHCAFRSSSLIVIR